jgi:serine/threonine protein kinase, bacterial
MTISSSVPTIAPQPPIHPRFVVLDVLASGDFGWGYLVKDLQHPGEQWVLEEFLPSPETPDNLVNVQNALRSALDPLQPLQHPQLAHSQDILLLDDRLFWLREYVPGISYEVLLEQRLANGSAFTEMEIRSLLLQLLPVLSELHQQQIFHHQIDRNTIIRRQSDQLPMMTRFGEIRDLGLAAGFYLLRPLQSWSIETGLAGIDRDLHDLAYMALTLLTGEDAPPSLTALITTAVDQTCLTPELATILDRMLIPKPWKRFQSADQVYTAIQQLAANPFKLNPLKPDPFTERSNPPPSNQPHPNQPRDPIRLILSFSFIALMSIALWHIATALLKLPNTSQLSASTTPASHPANVNPAIANSPSAHSSPPLNPISASPANNSATDQAEKFGMGDELLERLHQEIPADKLNQQLNRLSDEARNGMGNYYRRDYERWFATVAQMKISQPTIDILSDTLLYLRFPELQGKTLNPRTLGQLWYAIARDQITALNQKKNIEILNAGTFHQTGKLNQGQSRIFQVQAQPGQAIELKLNGPMTALRLSVIENEIVLLRYTNQTHWSAPRSLRGSTYEIILTPIQLDTVAYQLHLSRR